jgi:Glycosyl hydrolases family 16
VLPDNLLGDGPSAKERGPERSGPRHAAPRPRTRRWRLALTVLAATPVLIGGAAAASPLAGAVQYRVASPVTVQALGLSTPTPAVGQSVAAGAKVVAERNQKFDYVVIAVRDQAGRNFDFPGTANWRLGTTQQLYTSTRSFSAAGTYTYWFAYRQHGRWTNLSPKLTFTVGAPTGTPTPTPTSTSPSPTPSPTSTSPSPTPTSTSPSQSPTTSPSTGTPMPVGVPGSWTYKFGDDFTGPIEWGTKWAYKSSAEADGGQGNKGNQQLEWNQPQNCSTANGLLTITAKPDNITSPSGQHYDWSSCLITSTPSYAFRYGYIEIRAQFPSPKGFWPAFWTWQAPGNNQYTETDVFEYYSDNRTRLYLTQHSGAGGHYVYLMPFDPTTGFHTYGADIAPDGTRFYVDGRLVYTAPGTSTGLTNLIVDNFVYSRIPPDPGTVGTLKVDYVRAWQH